MSQPTTNFFRAGNFGVDRRFAFAVLMVLLLLPAAVQAQPKAKSDNLIHDFGVVPRGNVTDHTFELRNEGDADLVINQVRSSCACTVIDNPDVIPAGETGQSRSTSTPCSLPAPQPSACRSTPTTRRTRASTSP